jgi:hypothetical protein
MVNGMSAWGSPAEALGQIHKFAQSGQINDATMCVVAGLLKMAHDFQLPPNCLRAMCEVHVESYEGGMGRVFIKIEGNVEGGGRS